MTAHPPSAAKRIAHIRAHLDLGFTQERLVNATNNIRNGLGSPKGSAMSLANHAEAKAMSCWFENQDLDGMRNWFGVGARLERLVYQLETDTFGPGGKMLLLMKPLLSNDAPLIDWFANHDAAFDMARVEDSRTVDFWAYQAMIAIRGDWPRLKTRCELLLANPPGASAMQKYLGDHLFYLALAQGDKPGMEAALRSMVLPKAIKARSNDDSGFSADLISTAAVVYGKIAWLHGHKVEVDSPYIPREWLPATSLASYDRHYDFLA